MTEPFDDIIIHIAAWRRLRHNIKEVKKMNPEKYGEIADAFLYLMDLTYNAAAVELENQRESLKRNLEKTRENSRYGRMNE